MHKSIRIANAHSIHTRLIRATTIVLVIDFVSASTCRADGLQASFLAMPHRLCERPFRGSLLSFMQVRWPEEWPYVEDGIRKSVVKAFHRTLSGF